MTPTHVSLLVGALAAGLIGYNIHDAVTTKVDGTTSVDVTVGSAAATVTPDDGASDVSGASSTM